MTDYRIDHESMTEAEREYWEERAAIREFEAGQPRSHAELAAWLELRDKREREKARKDDEGLANRTA